MLDSRREFVWANALGLTNASEQPYTALEFLVGPPSFITDTLDHWDGRDLPIPHKTWLVWLRGLPVVPPGRRVPERLVMPRPSARNADTRMVERSRTPPSLASDLVRAWTDVARATMPRGGRADLYTNISIKG